jgi:hypothetical protein
VRNALASERERCLRTSSYRPTLRESSWMS